MKAVLVLKNWPPWWAALLFLTWKNPERGPIEQKSGTNERCAATPTSFELLFV
jgi:hypothetical protein